MDQKQLAIIVLIVMVALVAAYFAFVSPRYQLESEAPAPLLAPPAEPTPPPLAGPQPASESELAPLELVVQGDEFLFDPGNVSIKAGQTVKLIFKNIGRAPHNWTIEGQGIATKTISGASEDVLEFTAPSPGKYVVFCSVPGHRERGMVGELVVE